MQMSAECASERILKAGEDVGRSKVPRGHVVYGSQCRIKFVRVHMFEIVCFINQLTDLLQAAYLVSDVY